MNGRPVAASRYLGVGNRVAPQMPRWGSRPAIDSGMEYGVRHSGERLAELLAALAGAALVIRMGDAATWVIGRDDAEPEYRVRLRSGCLRG